MNIKLGLCVLFLSIFFAIEAPAISEYPQYGNASWYGTAFQGRKTASGERFDASGFTAAHRKLPFGSVVRVTNLRNGKSVEVKINDRGPFVKGRIIDLSSSAAKAIGLTRHGVARVRINIVSQPAKKT